MAGTLVISTLSDGTNSTSSTNCIQGSAKAWVRFAGASATINAAYNVSSITRNGTGDYTVNFTSAFADANYSANVTSGLGSAGGSQPTTATSVYAGTGGAIAPTTSSFRFYCLYGGGFVSSDSSYYNVAVFR